ncbi:MAG TPA: molybdopterin-binding/glycosyltransferase family 2 protein [Acetobacteraceae bacterium]|nr:molybdopterin-binding/glycosyltransferase family 2 protein [Acetobacteraceae bacterium]
MIFGSLSLEEAKGAILAHSLRLPGRMLRKGTLLDEAAITALGEAGLRSVMAARLEPGDVPEDVAADRLANALLSPLLGRSRAATGRVNLHAEAPGLLRIDTGKVERLNLLDEALTLATLPDHAVVAPREMVATIKIIPFAVPGTTLAVAEALSRQEKPLLRLFPFRHLRVGLVLTELPGTKESAIAHTIGATESRIAALTGTLLPPLRTPHSAEPVAAALRKLIADGADILLVAGASAVVDRRDVGPEGIVQAGGHILHFGMPVDPGNLICLGEIGERPALVLPGCARSPKVNGIDFVLSRLFAGERVGAAEVASMGIGGLLKEIETRPMPRDAAPATPRIGTAPRARPAIAAIVLAAGRSRRMAPHNKLLLPGQNGKPMIARVVDNVLSSAARPVLVVTGHQAEEIERALAGRPVRFVHAPDYAQGLSASLRAGIASVPPECAGAIICLGDMPLVTGRMIDRLLAAYDAEEGRTIVLPNFRGKQGNPMLWDRRYFPEILEITGDNGARFLLARHMEAVAEVEMGDDAVLRDVDTQEALDAMPKRF